MEAIGLTGDDARATAMRALRRDPAAVFALGGRSAALLWRSDYFAESLDIDQGTFRSLPPYLVEDLRNRFHLGVDAGWPLKRSPVQIFHRGMGEWYHLLFLYPVFAAAAVLLRPRGRRALLVLTLPTCALYCFMLVTGTEPLPRYFHPFAPLLVMVGSVLFFPPPRCSPLFAGSRRPAATGAVSESPELASADRDTEPVGDVAQLHAGDVETDGQAP